MLAFLGLPGHSEWIVILIVALLIFGKRLPSVMRSLAQSIVGFKHELRKAKEDLEIEDEDEDNVQTKKLPEAAGEDKETEGNSG